jgi:hypothetical protein
MSNKVPPIPNHPIGNTHEWRDWHLTVGNQVNTNATNNANIQTTLSSNSTVTNNVTNSASTGGASSLPANPAGYVDIVINGTTYKLPYYNV